MTNDDRTEASAFVCGPSRPGCECNCPDGPCDHKWDGESATIDDGRGQTVTCSRCGMYAINHDLWVGP